MGSPGVGVNLNQLTQQQATLAAAAAGGGFAIAPDAARQAAQLCQQCATTISGLLNSHGLERPPFLGSCWIGNNLSEHFHAKAIGTGQNDPNSVAGQIAGIVQLMTNLGQMFGSAADGYARNEQQTLDTAHQVGQSQGRH